MMRITIKDRSGLASTAAFVSLANLDAKLDEAFATSRPPNSSSAG